VFERMARLILPAVALLLFGAAARFRRSWATWPSIKSVKKGMSEDYDTAKRTIPPRRIMRPNPSGHLRPSPSKPPRGDQEAG